MFGGRIARDGGAPDRGVPRADGRRRTGLRCLPDARVMRGAGEQCVKVFARDVERLVHVGERRVDVAVGEG
ncbi:hypothetical protein WR25_09597 [Diploscapter pachys]|uniref:Uncharacterized protein n=1 Tax=Diploscapter pachys TaxID=2018661 RepID=A0A2A2M3Y6_9BILA|nr:hypothetical protein WR25_09597 [Diploscapter pachys]